MSRALLLVPAIVLGGCSRAPAPPQPIAPEPSPSATTSAAVEPEAGTGSPDAAAPLQGQRVQLTGLDAGEFAVVAQPDAAHSEGLLTTLAFAKSSDDVYAVTVDAASGNEMGRVLLGPSPGAVGTRLARGSRGAEVLLQGPKDAVLFELDPAPAIVHRYTLEGLGSGKLTRVVGFARYDDRIVIVNHPAAGEEPRLEILLLDAQGRRVGSHACRGGMFEPGNAELVHMGDQVVLANMDLEADGQAFCAGSLHGAPRWHEARLKSEGNIEVHVRGGAIYYPRPEGRTFYALDNALQPTGAPEPAPDPPLPRCSNVTGTALWQHDTVGDVTILRTTSCCGGPRGGLFLCRR